MSEVPLYGTVHDAPCTSGARALATSRRNRENEIYWTEILKLAGGNLLKFTGPRAMECALEWGRGKGLSVGMEQCEMRPVPLVLARWPPLD